MASAFAHGRNATKNDLKKDCWEETWKTRTNEAPLLDMLHEIIAEAALKCYSRNAMM
jgi:hypothetical protein